MSKTPTKTAATKRSTTKAKSVPKKSAAPKAPADQETKEKPKPSAPIGYVSFVGSGPGDPELLTVRAADLLRAADVVITEVPSHVDLVRSCLGLPEPKKSVDADGNEVVEPMDGPEIVDGGFGTDGQPLTHAARAKVVVRQAKTGRRVVRLMAGDPFVYASGPEEAQACVKAGIAFEIVPGVSSVTAVPAYAGIPLTTKNNREVAVVTCGETKVDWSQYADNRTLVLL
ncbi:MAG TPA: SAM-dependent methyltransferase, partial [Nocardioidaceae bacterium]|nr:SAM-dependent methyltransferase [Nocardioidaceae bacterium]